MHGQTDQACCLCRYKHEIRKEDKEALRKLIKVQYHYQVSPEITRELDASRCDLQHTASCILRTACYLVQHLMRGLNQNIQHDHGIDAALSQGCMQLDSCGLTCIGKIQDSDLKRESAQELAQAWGT